MKLAVNTTSMGDLDYGHGFFAIVDFINQPFNILQPAGRVFSPRESILSSISVGKEMGWLRVLFERYAERLRHSSLAIATNLIKRLCQRNWLLA